MGDPHTAWFQFQGGRQPLEDVRGINENNDGMVDELVESHALRSEECIAAFKAVDRGHFWPREGGDLAYADMPLRHGKLHLSAPHIYGKALESLMPLQPGMSFLNVGSGTGYFNCIVSELIGNDAANHGVELWPENVAHARERTARLGKHFMKFTQGNIYQLNVSDTMRYDRIYIGACANSKSKYIYRLLEVGGILIGPFQVGHSQQLRRVIRQTETQFFVEVLGSVQFACLIEPPRAAPARSEAPAVFAPPPRSAAVDPGFSAESGSATPATVSSSESMSVDGQQPIGLPGVPFTFSLLESPWSPQRNWLYPASFKRAVATGLLCRPKGIGSGGLPAEIWIQHVFPWCPRRWFEAEAPNVLKFPLGYKAEELEDESEDSASTRAPSSSCPSTETTPETRPSQPPREVTPLQNELSDTLFEVWGNGQRHAIGTEGDPDDAEPDRNYHATVPLRVLQLLAEEARSRRLRREEDEDSDEEHELENWDQDDEEDEAWEYEESMMDVDSSGLDAQQMNVEEDERML
mmetsp:Transcript_4358/g.7701  ORF Transcript_4358/g.7701 Transcript_4358/m.7701 type:complete len:522 (-) Transcript_4358:133-1698(-)|eukprot:CAMPEP_0197631866 /NCGR_PEP_ID=MMETSP1338-20131121/8887_1 /TAXON_ID=43686 ORGANISM="Pelagodinium beii, Strain RCC1491" /NCGR_SAMPLE_ID=MMETSP1338 /ASSEMBLY_ACC=CAM_ASM_000754 /LENGTH=521 /DNA_ID=CAMNT_0043203405 /DNA_START=141 /DNA_END=1706 /DNA_ORIENTATION=+